MDNIETDFYVCMPPVKTFEITIIVESIEKGKPSICDEVECE